MLALYHLFSGAAPTGLVGIDAVMQEASVETLPSVRRVVLVGNKISPEHAVGQAGRHGGSDPLGRAGLSVGR